MQGRTRPVSSGPVAVYDGGTWSCVRPVLLPGAQSGRGPQPSSAPIGRHNRRERRARRRFKEIVDYRRIRKTVGGPEGEHADVSGTLVCDECADTQESDLAVDRAVLVLVGASVGAAGDARRPRWPSTTTASSRWTATRPTSAGAGDDWEDVFDGTDSAFDTRFIVRPGQFRRRQDLHRRSAQGRHQHHQLAVEERQRPARTRTTSPTRSRPPTSDADNETIAYFGADRCEATATAQSASGSSSSTSARPAPSAGSLQRRARVGDVLVLSEYTNGGVVGRSAPTSGSRSGGNVATRHLRPGHERQQSEPRRGRRRCDVADGTFDFCAHHERRHRRLRRGPSRTRTASTRLPARPVLRGRHQPDRHARRSTPAVSARSSPRRAPRSRDRRLLQDFALRRALDTVRPARHRDPGQERPGTGHGHRHDQLRRVRRPTPSSFSGSEGRRSPAPSTSSSAARRTPAAELPNGGTSVGSDIAPSTARRDLRSSSRRLPSRPRRSPTLLLPRRVHACGRVQVPRRRAHEQHHRVLPGHPGRRPDRQDPERRHGQRR